MTNYAASLAELVGPEMLASALASAKQAFNEGVKGIVLSGAISNVTGIFGMMDNRLRLEADKQLVTTLRVLLKKIGVAVLTSMHDDVLHGDDMAVAAHAIGPARTLVRAAGGSDRGAWPRDARGAPRAATSCRTATTAPRRTMGAQSTCARAGGRRRA